MISKDQLHPNDLAFFHDYIGYTYGKFCIARAYQPKVIIEIGVRAGYSAHSFLRASPHAKYFGFDAENNSHGGEGGPYMPHARKLLQPYGDNITLVEMDTQEVSHLNGDMGSQTLKADFIHVDGDHTKAGVIHDLEMVLQHLTPDGVILIDDVDRIQEVKDGVAEFLQNHPELDHSYLPSFNGDVLIGRIIRLGGLPQSYDYGSSISIPEGSLLKVRDPVYIDSYADKKLVEYLAPGQRVLIRFGHGLGDTIMFMVIFERLKELYPAIHFEIYLECGQEEIFESCPDKEGKGFDYVFHLDYRMAEGSGITKNAKCCRDEIGIEPIEGLGLVYPEKYESPLVAVHFQGTALPESVGIPRAAAEEIWKAILNVGLIPIEVHFEHVFHNPKNTKYDFVNRHVRATTATIPNLIGLLKSCRAFIGCASGPYVTSIATLGVKRTLLIEVNHKVTDYFPRLIDAGNMGLPVNQVTIGAIEQWLNSI